MIADIVATKAVGLKVVLAVQVGEAELVLAVKVVALRAVGAVELGTIADYMVMLKIIVVGDNSYGSILLE